jgi:hypothetical protein
MRLRRLAKKVESEEEDNQYNDFDQDKEEDIYKENFDIIEEDNEENNSIKANSEKSISLDDDLDRKKSPKVIKERETKRDSKRDIPKSNDKPTISSRRFESEDKLDKLVYDEIERKVLSNSEIMSSSVTNSHLKQVNLINH